MDIKIIIFKYTYKARSARFPKTFYVEAYTEENAREALSKHLKVNPRRLWLSKKNLPYAVRQKIFDTNNKDFIITLRDDTPPENNSSIEKRQAEVFDLKLSLQRSLEYKINALFSYNKTFMAKYPSISGAYKALRAQLHKADMQDEPCSHNPNITLLDLLDSFNFNSNLNSNGRREKNRRNQTGQKAEITVSRGAQRPRQGNNVSVQSTV